jgi:drug/metabolite transporter (DMT)-like permease
MATQVKMKTNINPLLLAIPASCDVCGSTLMFVALVMVPPSVYQMMRGLIVVITALMSIIFLKRKQYRHHWTGIVLIITGVFLVGYVSIKAEGSSGSDSGGSEVFGIFLLICSQMFTGAMFIIEEKLLGDYYLEPFQIVGCEGMWGLAYYIILLPIMQLVKCPNQTDPKGFGKMCDYGYLENSSFAFWQMGENGNIVMLVIFTIVCIAFFNSFGIACTKYASAAQRSTIDTSRTLTIWILSVLLGLESFVPWEIPGFILLICGTLMYNEIVVIPYFGYDQWTKDAIANRKGATDRASQKEADANYIATSPGAAYDSKRNIRQLQKKAEEGNNPAALEGEDFDMNAVQHQTADSGF